MTNKFTIYCAKKYKESIDEFLAECDLLKISYSSAICKLIDKSIKVKNHTLINIKK